MAVDPARAKSLFLNASELADPAERAAYLDRECGEDDELRGRVDALLRVNDEAPLPPGPGETTLGPASRQVDTQATGVHTESPEGDPSPISITAEYGSAPRPNILIAGRYTLQEKLGEGGMGEVWVAKQSEPVKRKVALKLIKPGMDSRAVLQRFEQERQALALMDHTNIAKVLDAGMTPNGQPFFVMELVNGLPLNKFCDELKLTPKERLELFVPICQAVQHAHQKGIVHRDLKPANILITMIDGKPVPKVIDFGVAKATAGKLTDESMSTQFGAVVGTLEYMSPEQAGFSGEDIDTRADIYSLGVILYEMLTGLRPLDAARLKKAAMTEMIRIIREDEPSKPSTRLSTDEALPSLAALRQTDPRKLMTILRGDLDWVVMKCLEKHRERRYETANALARDVRRYLDGEAVEACPPSVGYRMGKFLKRNRGPVLAASFVLLALVAGLIGTAWGLVRADRARRAEAVQRKIAVEQKTKAEASEALAKAQRSRAEQREEQAIDAVKRFRDAVADNPELKNNPALEPLRKTLLKEPLAFFRSLRERLQSDRDTRPAAMVQLADVIHDYAHLAQEIGNRMDGLKAHEDTLSIWRRLADDDPGNPKYLANLAIVQDCRANFLKEIAGRKGAREGYEQARQIQERLVHDYPENPSYAYSLATTNYNLGDFLHGSGEMVEARSAFERGIFHQERLVREHPEKPEYLAFLASISSALGRLLDDLGDSAGARACFERALKVQKQLVSDYPLEASHKQELAKTLGHLGGMRFALGDSAGASVFLEGGSAILEQLVREHPTETIYFYDLATMRCNQAILFKEASDYNRSRETCDKARMIAERLTQDHPTTPAFAAILAKSHLLIGDLLSSTGDLAGAKTEFEQALAIQGPLARENPTVLAFNEDLGTMRNAVGLESGRNGDTAGARAHFEAANVIFKGLVREHPDIPEVADNMGIVLYNLATLEIAARRFDKARDDLREAISWARKALASSPKNLNYRDRLRVKCTMLLSTAGELNDPVLASEAQKDLDDLDATDEQRRARDERLNAISGGESAKNNAERLTLANHAFDKKRFVMAARLWSELIQSDPKLGDDRQAQHRYNAACAAAQAGCGKGKDDPAPDEAAMIKLRKQALDWLTAELKAWKRVSMTAEPGNKEFVAKTLAHWKQDADLAGIRDESELAKLPDAERKEWQSLWADVDALLKRAQASKP